MGVFNFIETFFFISLGITFVLILLLVYHFKQRLNTIEQKSDTMFEIINNIVQEITSIKKFCMQPPIQRPAYFPPQSTHLASIPEFVPSQKILKPDDNYSIQSSDTESESDEESTDGSDDGSDDGTIDSIDGLVRNSNDPRYSNKIVVSDDEITSEYNTIKVIQIESQQLHPDNTANNQIVDVVKLDEPDNLNVIQEDVLLEHVLLEHVFELTEVVEPSEFVEPCEFVEPIQPQDNVIQSDDTDEHDTLDTHHVVSLAKDRAMEIYSKMSTVELKAMVIQKGLNTDPSNIKRARLLKLLEKSIE